MIIYFFSMMSVKQKAAREINGNAINGHHTNMNGGNVNGIHTSATHMNGNIMSRIHAEGKHMNGVAMNGNLEKEQDLCHYNKKTPR